MSVKLGIIIGFIASFLLSLFLDVVRSFLLGLSGRILRYFKDKNFKCYKLFFYNSKEIKGLFGEYYFCYFNNKTYIINTQVLPREKPIYKAPILNNGLSSVAAQENTVGITQNSHLELRMEEGYNFSNSDLIEILDGFSLYKEEKQALFLSDTLYVAIRNKLQKEKFLFQFDQKTILSRRFLSVNYQREILDV